MARNNQKLIQRLTAPLLLTLLWWLAVLAIDPSGNFPLNDDWHYGALVKSYVEQGRFIFNDEISPNLSLQLFWGSFFCRIGGDFSFTWLRWSTLVLGWGTVLCVYRLLRLRQLPAGAAFWGTLALGFSPVFFSLSFTFMTDVPFLFCSIAAILAFATFVRRDRKRFLLAAYALSLAAYLIRLPGLLLIPAFETAWFLASAKSRRRKGRLIAGWIVPLAFLVLTESVLKPEMGLRSALLSGSELLDGRYFQDPGLHLLQFFKNGVRGIVITGFFLIPLTPQIWRKSREQGWFRLQRFLPIVFLLLGGTAALRAAGWTFPFSKGGNIFYNFGLGAPLLRDWTEWQMDIPPDLPLWLMTGIGLWAALTGILFFLVFFSHALKKPGNPFYLFLLLLTLGYMSALSIYSYHDRYFLLPFAVGGIYLLTFPPRQRFPLSVNVVLIILYTWFSITATHDYLAWNRASANLIETLQARGIDATEIDGGTAYNGFTLVATGNAEARYILTFQPVEGYRTVDSKAWYSWLSLHRRQIFAIDGRR